MINSLELPVEQDTYANSNFGNALLSKNNDLSKVMGSTTLPQGSVENSKDNYSNYTSLTDEDKEQLKSYDDAIKNYEGLLNQAESSYQRDWRKWNNKLKDFFLNLPGMSAFKEQREKERDLALDEIKNYRNLLIESKSNRNKLLNELIANSNKYINAKKQLDKAGYNPLLLAENLGTGGSISSLSNITGFNSNVGKFSSTSSKGNEKNSFLALILLLLKLLG